MAKPSGWPAEVPDQETEGWERYAVAWLYDHCPPDYRGYDVFRRHPIVLAHVAKAHLAAAAAAVETGIRTVRHDLRGLAGPQTVDEAAAAYELERHRLRAAALAADLVWQALRGERWTPKL
jgi:hypothetical protein